MKTLGFTLLVALGCGSKSSAPKQPAQPLPKQSLPSDPIDNATPPPVVDDHKWMKSKTPDELTWTPLDPSAGDKGPQVAALWGDMQSEPSGFFIKLPAGNPGMLHTHSAEYHGVAIAGSATNAQDGTKKPVPLTSPAYWYQPGGLAHTTACGKGTDCIALVHLPAKFDFAPAKPTKGAKPDARYVEKHTKALDWKPLDPKNPKGVNTASLWGDATSQPNGQFLRIPAGAPPFWHIHKFDYHGVVLAGTVNNVESGKDTKDLPVGSYWWQPGGNKHTTNCKAGGPDCIVYVFFTGKFDVIPAE